MLLMYRSVLKNFAVTYHINSDTDQQLIEILVIDIVSINLKNVSQNTLDQKDTRPNKHF